MRERDDKRQNWEGERKVERDFKIKKIMVTGWNKAIEILTSKDSCAVVCVFVLK